MAGALALLFAILRTVPPAAVHAQPQFPAFPGVYVDIATPSTNPGTGGTKVYTKNGTACALSPLGVETCMGSGSGSGGMTQISQTTLAMAAASITFSSIPAGYTNLTLTITGRGDTAANVVNIAVQFNGDTGTNYNNINQLSTGAFSSNATATPIACVLAAANTTANYAGNCNIMITGYGGTVFNKHAFANSEWFDSSSHEQTGMNTFSWNNTAAITQVLLKPTAGNLITGTVATLWGTK